jgi:hypothetical protein
MSNNKFYQHRAITNCKPIEVNLIGGNIEITTGTKPEVIIEAFGMTNEGLIPLIHEEAESIVISKQKLRAFLPQNETVLMRLTLPENAMVHLKAFAGNISFSGNYDSIQARLMAGNIKIGLPIFSVQNKAFFRIWAGTITFITGKVHLDFQTKTERYAQFSLPGKAKVEAKATLGDVHFFKAWNNP